MIYTLLYVSRNLVDVAGSSAEVSRIVEVSRPRNAALGVTGALIFAESHFAQSLEGTQAAVEELMQSIRRDPRHCDIRVLQAGEAQARRFAHWSLAYYGPSALLGDLFDPAAWNDDHAGHILAVMSRFALLEPDQ